LTAKPKILVSIQPLHLKLKEEKKIRRWTTVDEDEFHSRTLARRVKAGSAQAVSYLRSWSFICGSIAVCRFNVVTHSTPAINEWEMLSPVAQGKVLGAPTDCQSPAM